MSPSNEQSKRCMKAAMVQQSQNRAFWLVLVQCDEVLTRLTLRLGEFVFFLMIFIVDSEDSLVMGRF